MIKTCRPSVMVAVLAALSLVVLTGGAPSAQNQMELALKAAIDKEVVEGDLKSAIDLYRQIATAGDRAVAARALVRMGQCYEKLGAAQASAARAAYERVVREFADQKEAAEQARARLAAGGREREIETGLAVQRRWVLPAGRTTQMQHVSADGRYIPFVDQTAPGLWLHDLTTGEDRKVVDAQAGEYLASPELSPDMRQLAYTRLTRGDRPPSYDLRISSLDGSRTRILVDNKQRWLWPKAWSPDGKRILILMQKGSKPATGFSMALVSAVDASIQELTAGNDDVSNGCFSPDGKFIVTYRASADAGRMVRLPGGLKLIPVDGSTAVPLFESSAANWSPFWTPDGRKIVFFSDRSGSVDMWSMRVSGGRPQGEPELVKREAGSIDADPIGFTRDGVFYYKTSNVQSDIYTAGLDPATGRIISTPVQINQRSVGSAGGPMAWSPDGQFLVYARVSRRELGYAASRVAGLVLRSDRTGEEREILPVPAFDRNSPQSVIWLPDGRSLLTENNSARGFLLYQIDPQTGRIKEFLALDGGSNKAFYPVLSPDGKTLYYVQYAGPTARLMQRDLASGEVRALYQARDVELDGLALSADGRQLAFAISDWNPPTYSFSLVIMPVEGGAVRERLKSRQYINNLVWMRDGRNMLMVRESETGPPQLWTVPIDGGEPQPSGLAMRGLYSIPLHPDGRRIAYVHSREPQEEVWMIRNLLSEPNSTRK
jgi:Tol biopolymer transport system component